MKDKSMNYQHLQRILKICEEYREIKAQLHFYEYPYIYSKQV